MKIELDKEDIINQIDKHHSDDMDLIYQIIDCTASTWHSVRNITRRLIEELIKNDEVADLDDMIKKYKK